MLSADRDIIEFIGGGSITIDCNDFIFGIGKLRSGASDIHPQPDHRSAGTLASCMDRYRGEFLEGFNLKDSPEFDSWQVIKREELRQLATWARVLIAASDINPNFAAEYAEIVSMLMHAGNRASPGCRSH